MEENVNVTQGAEGTAVKSEEVVRLQEDLEDAKRSAEYYKGKADEYYKWWFDGQKKLNSMKEDVELMQKLLGKLVKNW